MAMKPTAILFAYHVWDKPTLRNFNSFVKHNGFMCDVIPVSFATIPAGKYFKGAPKDQWAFVDTLIYTWFMESRPKYLRYIFMESDCYCSQPVCDFYGDSYGADFACAEFKSHAEHNHADESFGDRGLKQAIGLPHYLNIYKSLRACVPVAGALFHHEALEAVCDEIIHTSWMQFAFSEIRMGTAVNLAGIKPQIIRPDIKNFICTDHRLIRGKGIFHKATTFRLSALWHLKELTRLTFTRSKRA